jgi:hypothetical protein
MATQANWLHRTPPLRAPKRPHRHHHYRHHDLGDSVEDGIGYAANNTVWFMLVTAAGMLWIYEIIFWGCVWFYYGLFLGCRWVWRNNPIGRAAETVAGQRTVPVDPFGAPVDLADYSEQPVRRRSPQ